MLGMCIGVYVLWAMVRLRCSYWQFDLCIGQLIDQYFKHSLE